MEGETTRVRLYPKLKLKSRMNQGFQKLLQNLARQAGGSGGGGRGGSGGPSTGAVLGGGFGSILLGLGILMEWVL